MFEPMGNNGGGTCKQTFKKTDYSVYEDILESAGNQSRSLHISWVIYPPQAKDAADAINKFVNQTTRGKIAKLVNPSDVAWMPAVLVNAVYFKGLWLSQFNPNNTVSEDFYSTPNTSKPVEMMIQSAEFKYGELQ